MAKEVRFNKNHEIRAGVGADSAPTVTGYAARFNSLSLDLGGFVEKISPGAFTDSLAANDICAFWSHNPDLPLGRTSENTLQLRQDDFGLAFTLELGDTTCGVDAYKHIKRGDVKGVSFGFEPQEDEWFCDSDGNITRTLLKVNLFEISPTAIPAYTNTSVSARALEKVKTLQEELAWKQHQETGRLVSEARAQFEQKLLRRKYLQH